MPGATNRRLLAAVLATAIAALTVAAVASAHARHHARRHSSATDPQFTASVFANAATITHPLGTTTEPVSKPDDLTRLGSHIFVAFQNGVGAQGEPSPSNNLDSTIVEFNTAGQEITQWDITGKCDGLVADPLTGKLIATVNEDAKSSVYLIKPDPGSTPVQYQYNEPLDHYGGTDAVSVYNGTVLVSASAPGTSGGAAAPQASYPAVYRVYFKQSNHTAYVRGLFSDEAPAVVANTNSPSFGSTEKLGLTDPDSNSVVPSWAHRFAGDFMLSGQGDEKQIFFGGDKPLAALSLGRPIDDNVWPSGGDGVLLTTDSSANAVIAVTGPFERGSEVAAVTPCNSNNAPSTCPGPGFPANYLGEINQWTGAITALKVNGVAFQPKGMLFIPDAHS